MPVSHDPTELLVCVTCRSSTSPGLAPDAPRAGARLFDALDVEGMPRGVRLRAVECLSNCNRGCTVALRGGDARWSYLYGDLDPEAQVATILDGAARYAATADGLVPWRERPEHFRKNCIGRFPPLTLPEAAE